jgi:hypothetical protein
VSFRNKALPTANPNAKRVMLCTIPTNLRCSQPVVVQGADGRCQFLCAGQDTVTSNGFSAAAQPLTQVSGATDPIVAIHNGLLPHGDGSAVGNMPSNAAGFATPADILSVAAKTLQGAFPNANTLPGAAAAGVLSAMSVPGAGVPGAGVPGAGVPGAGVPGAGVPGAGVPGVGVPGAGVPGAGVPGAGVPGAGVPGAGVPGAGVPGAGEGARSMGVTNCPVESHRLDEAECANAERVRLFDEDVGCYFDVCKFQRSCAQINVANDRPAPNTFQTRFDPTNALRCRWVDASEYNTRAKQNWASRH